MWPFRKETKEQRTTRTFLESYSYSLSQEYRGGSYELSDEGLKLGHVNTDGAVQFIFNTRDVSTIKSGAILRRTLEDNNIPYAGWETRDKYCTKTLRDEAEKLASLADNLDGINVLSFSKSN